MFAVIYQSWIHEGKEEEFKKYWHIVASYFVTKRGALGSALHKTQNGYWLAYSRWPDKKTRDNSWPGNSDISDEFPDEVRLAILGIRDCKDQNREVPEIHMEVVDDILRD
jgi:hypothetical protein